MSGSSSHSSMSVPQTTATEGKRSGQVVWWRGPDQWLGGVVVRASQTTATEGKRSGQVAWWHSS